MLVLTRKLNESIIIDGDIRITIVGIRGNHVRVGIEAPASIPIIRKELQDDRARADALYSPPTGHNAQKQCPVGGPV
jgi:carbon storage regulator